MLKCLILEKQIEGITITTVIKHEEYRSPSRVNILFNGTEVTFEQMCKLTIDIAKEALTHVK